MQARRAVPLDILNLTPIASQDAPACLRSAILAASTTTLGRPSRLPFARAFHRQVNAKACQNHFISALACRYFMVFGKIAPIPLLSGVGLGV